MSFDVRVLQVVEIVEIVEISSSCGNRTLPLQLEKLAASPEAQRAKLFSFWFSVLSTQDRIRTCNLPGLNRIALPLAHLSIHIRLPNVIQMS